MMYRSRLGTDLSNITLDYVSSINDDSEIALYDIIGSQAHTIMLLQNNIITKKDAKKILSSTLTTYFRNKGDRLLIYPFYWRKK